ncbi:MAG: histidine kinase [Bacteroidetes bacterium]|nr:histidine kinase [Bacteroidota bacterium]
MQLKPILLFYLLLLTTSLHAQNAYVDSLLNWLQKNQQRDTQRVITTHKLSYRLSEINAARSWTYARETELLANQLGFKKGECLANINYAILEAVEGNYKNSADYYLKAIQLASSIRFTRGLSISYNNIGENYIRLKEYDKALEYLQKAFVLNDSIQELRGQAINLENMGSIQFTRKDYSGALNYWNKGFDLAKRSKDPNILSLLHVDFAKYYTEIRNFSKAFAELHIADSIASLHHEVYYQILSYKAFANVYEKIDKPDSAILFLHKALHATRSLGNKNEECDIYNQIATNFESRRIYDSGMYYLRKHKELSDTVLSDKNFAHLAFIQTRYETQIKDEENRRLKHLQVSQKKEIKEKNWLLIASAVALCLAFLSIFLIYLSYKDKKHNLELHEQKNASEYRQQLTELEVKSLRSQMNPHFIFNSLNSIRNYIIKNEPHIASNYLAQFASLMRKILDASQQSYIYIDEEMEMLKLYLELELMRFSQRFEYSITLEPEIEQANYKIPSMVLQPFIENAIWHGLLNKENGHGVLSIHFKEFEKDDNRIICVITDNGIGRAKSAELKNSLKQHQSKGLQITGERLLRLSHGEIAQPIEFEDLHDENGEACGTKVTIHLPIA